MKNIENYIVKFQFTIGVLIVCAWVIIGILIFI